MPTLSFVGTVFSGSGQGKRFIELPWVNRQIAANLGFLPYPGTLNIRLTSQSTQKRNKLEKSEGILVEPAEGYFLGVLYRALIEGLECAVVVPKVPNYPADVLEIIAPTYLREQLKLGDGKEVTVAVIV
ncbi:MAG: CTP-dependent riboflavin kinase [Candidatus Bathyarchaeota archaeon]|nr:CTP-dependent riboflavin kinase [Candidatus Bathyarchaeota archaeon]